MRDRKVIAADGMRVDLLQLEVLLDIRELLKPPPKRRGRPLKKTK